MQINFPNEKYIYLVNPCLYKKTRVFKNNDDWLQVDGVGVIDPCHTHSFQQIKQIYITLSNDQSKLTI